MRNDPHQASRLLQVQQRPDRKVQALGIKRAEALIDKQRIKLDPTRARLHHVGQPQRQRQRSEEALAARQRVGRARRAGVVVEHFDIEPAGAALVALFAHALQHIAAAAHRQQPR
ncbi:hypothetical protein D3C72_1900350 [compost metagenome]